MEFSLCEWFCNKFDKKLDELQVHYVHYSDYYDYPYNYVNSFCQQLDCAFYVVGFEHTKNLSPQEAPPLRKSDTQ